MPFQSSGNTSPIVLQRFYHQSQQRRSRVDLHITPRHRSLSREHSAGRSPRATPACCAPPPPPPSPTPPHAGSRRCVVSHQFHTPPANGTVDLEPATHERLHPASPLLPVARLCEGRSQSLNTCGST
ncbi:hypothetical protein ACJJTC_009406 [Scirpophaga incertulas]